MLIKDALEEIRVRERLSDQYELSRVLKVSQPTISNYYKNNSYPNLRIAGYIYGKYGIRCEPFTEEALKKEWEFQKGRL